MDGSKHTTLIVCILIIATLALMIFLETPCSATGNVLHVGSGQEYTSVQAAINDANENDTIYIHSTTYNENIQIDKNLIITGENQQTTIINGVESNKHTLEITASSVYVSTLTIKNSIGSTNHYSCIFLNTVSSSTITNITVKNGENGIYLLDATANTISYNTIEENDQNGIFLSNSDGNTIDNNVIQNNGNGVYLTSGSANNVILKNTISQNTPYGIRSVAASNNVFYKNDFSENAVANAYDTGINSWSDNSQGNYWSDYNGNDDNHDGIGDTPYTIAGGSNIDAYPLGYFTSSIEKPVASIISITPNPATLGQTVSFIGQGSDNGIIIDWEWKSDRDGILSHSEDFSSTSLSLGSHVIQFRIKDDDDLWSDYVQHNLIITLQEPQINQKPSAQIISINPSKILDGESVYLHGVGTDPDGIIVGYKWRSSIDESLSDLSSFSFTDFSIGTHIIFFSVQDNHGEWSEEDKKTLIVNLNPSPPNNPPTPDSGGPYTAMVNTSIHFDASLSSDQDGDEIIDYSWDFGDGTTGTGKIVDHSYTSTGNYTVTLTITDNQQTSSTVTTYAVISINSNNSQLPEGANKSPMEENTTPGFEIIFVILVLSLVIWVKRKVQVV